MRRDPPRLIRLSARPKSGDDSRGTKKVSVCLVTVHSPVQFLAAVARLAVTRLAVVARLALAVTTLLVARAIAALVSAMTGAIGAGVCDVAACGVCGIRAGTCDKVACVVLAVLTPWVIPAVLVVWEVVGVIW